VLRKVLFLLLGLALGMALYPLVNKQFLSPSDGPIEQSRRNAIVLAVEHVAPSVVSINTAFVHDDNRFPTYRDPFYDFSYDLRKIPGIGSGFVIQSDGYILTNSHVVDGAQEIHVTFPDGRRFEVLEIFIDRQLDLAVIHIDADNLPVPDMGNSSDVIIGEWAIALGNPFGLRFEDPKPTVTVGVISAVDRIVRPEENEPAFKGMIQTDASINPGNSGGPLVNSLGHVIGVNTFIFSQGGALGIGFALPINRAIESARQLIDRGSREFWTGLDFHSLSPTIARALGLSTAKGALITVVEPLSPGESAGLRSRDVIVMVNGKLVYDANDLIEAFRYAAVGDIFYLKILRGRADVFDVKLVLEQDPKSESD
jgi:serine protease Do